MSITSEPNYADPSAYLRGKRRAIVVNNVYPKPFGSDPFMVGQMPLQKRWHIPLPQLKQNIEYLSQFTKFITLVGGDPRMHPEWANIIEMLYHFKDIDFIVKTRIDITNFKMPVDKNNVRYWGEMICKRGRPDVPILIAAIDILPGQSKYYYWGEARKYCEFWRYYPTPIYDNKVYYCVVAASIARVFGMDIGWTIDPEQDAFDHPKEEIEEQAKDCCFHCGCSLYYKDPDMFPEQNLIDSAMTSVSNLK